ncbi:hypothetical protein C1E24_10190 [Pseudoalteromonas phenolica]|uniref:Uncharacterized protein n=1 Tax=Pseudoalteromonas phenolica TaxID=161398 RepID=A0A5R9Q2Y4_9GAMM|nr:hypothetical protein C1E24_10190 [Pseudoalteromonas phenolica]
MLRYPNHAALQLRASLEGVGLPNAFCIYKVKIELSKSRLQLRTSFVGVGLFNTSKSSKQPYYNNAACFTTIA